MDADFPHAVVGGAASVLFEIFWFRTADPGAAEPIGGAVAKVCCDIWFECAAILSEGCDSYMNKCEQKHVVLDVRLLRDAL